MDMGQSVLTPEENLLGKASGVLPFVVTPTTDGGGGKGIRPTFRNQFVGNGGFKAVDDGRSRVI